MRFLAIIILFVVVLGGAAFGLLVYTGTIKLGPPKAVALKPRERQKGEVLVPWCVRLIPAGTLMTREWLADPKTGQMVSQPLVLEKFADKHIVANTTEIIGRVLKKDKRPGYPFVETDFDPVGTRPGVTSFIPPGKRSVTLDVSKVTGVRFLKQGDHVDLLAAQSYDPSKPRTVTGIPGVGAVVSPSALTEPPVKQAKIKILAQDAVVVTPITLEELPVSKKGKEIKTQPHEEIQIAVEPEEVLGVEEAVAAKADISCVVHSGQPESSTTEIINPPPPAPDAPPAVAQNQTVEKIVGRVHKTLIVPTTAPSASSSGVEGGPPP